MLEHIKSLYGQAFVSDEIDIQDSTAYYWFRTDSGIPFGLRKHAVTEKEYQLLSLTYKTVDMAPKLLTEDERLWSALLFENAQKNIHIDTSHPRFLLHIHFKNPFKEIESFNEAIFALFDESPIVLWKNQQTAILVLVSRTDFNMAEEVIHLLASDFYSDARIFIGSALINSKNIHHRYKIEEQAFDLARHAFPEKRVFTYEKIVPLLLVSTLPYDKLDSFFSTLLDAIENGDPEWVNSLFAFFENGMNITAASKALFIHRNSLQYRLDKFSEKTGLDPKQFEDALYIYLALLTKKLS